MKYETFEQWWKINNKNIDLKSIKSSCEKAYRDGFDVGINTVLEMKKKLTK